MEIISVAFGSDFTLSNTIANQSVYLFSSNIHNILIVQAPIFYNGYVTFVFGSTALWSICGFSQKFNFKGQSKKFLICLTTFTSNAGSSTYPNMTFGWVSVKDVAEAHILAFEVPSANGRYILVENVAHYSEIVKILSNYIQAAHSQQSMCV
jgi:hypothetical protein